jgi:hypothetical protein
VTSSSQQQQQSPPTRFPQEYNFFERLYKGNIRRRGGGGKGIS